MCFSGYSDAGEGGLDHTERLFQPRCFCNSVIRTGGAPSQPRLREPPPGSGLEPAAPDVTRGAQADPAPAAQPARGGRGGGSLAPPTLRRACRRHLVREEAAAAAAEAAAAARRSRGRASRPPPSLAPCFPPARPRRPAAAAPCLPRAPSPPRPRSRRWVAGPRSAGSPAGPLPPPSARPGLSLPPSARGAPRAAAPAPIVRAQQGRPALPRPRPCGAAGGGAPAPRWLRSGCSRPIALCPGLAGPKALPRSFSGLGPASCGCSAGRDGLRLTIAMAGWTPAIIRRLNVCFTSKKWSVFNVINSGAEIPKSQRP